MFTFNGVHSSALGINVNYPNIQSLPPVRNYLDIIDGKDGIYDFGLNYNEKYISFDCNFISNSFSEAIETIDNINKFFNPKEGSKRLILDVAPDRYCLARLYNALDIQRIITSMKNGGQFQLTFMISDPFFYSVTEYNEQYTANGTHSFTIGGNYETLPVLTIVADIQQGGDNLIFNFNNTHVLEIKSVMETTYKLEVDCKNRNIKYINIATEVEENGLLYVEKISFPPLLVGDNTLEIAESSTLTTLTSIDIDYNRRYF